ncbi:OmpA family protein [Polaribacter staleyi]|uniref:OmpA family protein n=1 Tax=Polaribacter staleyi TaxID=2022337 RepID=UPI0031B9F07E
MKKTTNLLVAFLMIFAFTQNSEAQIWKRLKKKAEEALVKGAEKKIDKTINGDEDEEEPSSNDSKNIEDEEFANNDTPNLWRNFRFVPGENVVFYDDLTTEEVGEFPARWDLVKGSAEVAELDGEKVIIFMAEAGNTITPLIKSTDYLGNEFTIEYDILVPNFRQEKIWWMEHNIFFNPKFYNKDVHIELREQIGKLNGWASNTKFKIEDLPIGAQNDWHHISISYYHGKYKMYYDSKRIANIPRFDVTPTVFGINLSCHSNSKKAHPYLALKNVRIAHGGGEMYKKIIADGKYVTNGIIFDSGKTEIKKPSLGIINKIVKILKDNSDWTFNIVGYTDNDGDDDLNLKLSEERANAVKQAIVEQGISTDRLTITGKGKADPLNNNSSPEEKANNRRVAFIKK